MLRKVLAGAIVAILLLPSSLALEQSGEVVELRGEERYIVRTITLPAEQEDLAQYTDASFERDGYSYEFSAVTSAENWMTERRQHSEVVTVACESDEVEALLPFLEAELFYESDGYSGILKLQLDSIQIEAVGYEMKYFTVNDTKIYSGLHRNDPSLVPPTTVKNGVTLSLQNIAWQATGGSVVEGLALSQNYTAVATYAGTTSRKEATGYAATLCYEGELVKESLESVTHSFDYRGTAIPKDNMPHKIAGIGVAAGLLLLLLALVLYRQFGPNVKVYAPGGKTILGRYRLTREQSGLDLSILEEEPFYMVELNRQAVRELVYELLRIHLPGNEIAVHFVEPCGERTYLFVVQHDDPENETLLEIVEEK